MYHKWKVTGYSVLDHL